MAVVKHNGHFIARQIDAGVAVSVHDGAAGHGEVVQLLVISFQGHIACGHGEGKAFAGFPALRRVHQIGTVTGKLPAIKFMVRIEEGVRRFHRDGFTFQRLCALLIVHKNRASVLVHRHIVNRSVLGFQRHVACGHFKGELRVGLPAAFRPAIPRCFGFGICRLPLLELILDTRALGKRNLHFIARLEGTGGFAGPASVHDGAAGHGEVVQLLVISGQDHIACGHFKGKFFAVLPAIGQARGLRAAERPLIEPLRIRVLRGRNGHHFTGIEAGIADAICLGGDTFRQGKGVKGVGFDAQIRRCAADGAAGMELSTILCGLVEIALARWRRIGDVLCRQAEGVLVDDFYLIGIFNGRIAGNDRFRSLASCYGNAAALFYIQPAENRRAAAVGNGNGSGGANACTTLHKGGTIALIAGNAHLTGAVFHREFFTGHLSLRVAQLHFAGAGQGNISADSRCTGIASAYLHTAAVVYGQLPVHSKAAASVGNAHGTPAGDISAIVKCGIAGSGHRNIAGTAGVLHGQLAAHGNAAAVADVHCAAAGNVGLITDSILLCVANNGHTGAAVDGQIALNRNAGFILDAYVSARRNGGLALDSSIIVARHSDGTTGGHSQPSAHRRAA